MGLFNIVRGDMTCPRCGQQIEAEVETRLGWMHELLTLHVGDLFAGVSLQPVPEGGTPKSKDARWIDIDEADELNEAQMAAWIKQAAALPGWIP